MLPVSLQPVLNVLSVAVTFAPEVQVFMPALETINFGNFASTVGIAAKLFMAPLESKHSKVAAATMFGAVPVVGTAALTDVSVFEIDEIVNSCTGASSNTAVAPVTPLAL